MREKEGPSITRTPETHQRFLPNTRCVWMGILRWVLLKYEWHRVWFNLPTALWTCILILILEVKRLRLLTDYTVNDTEAGCQARDVWFQSPRSSSLTTPTCFPLSRPLATCWHCCGHSGHREPRPKGNRTKMYCTHRARVRAFGTRGDGQQGKNGDITGWRLTVKSSGHHPQGSSRRKEETKGLLVILKDLVGIQREFCTISYQIALGLKEIHRWLS